MNGLSKQQTVDAATTPEQPTTQGPGLDRREALKKMGKYAAYTAPTMMALLVTDKANAATITVGDVRIIVNSYEACIAAGGSVAICLALFPLG